MHTWLPDPDPADRVEGMPPPPGYGPEETRDDWLASLTGLILGALLVWSFVEGWWH